MKEEDIAKEAEQAVKEIEEERARKHSEKIEEDKKANPFSYLLVLILILLIIMMSVPFYGIKLDPEPKNIPEYSEVVSENIKDKMELRNISGSNSNERANFVRLLSPDDPIIKNLAVKIATSSCRQSEVCYSKALFYFVRDNFQYISDPPNDYLETPFETLYNKGADCDGLAILLANLQLAIGIPTRFVFIPGHVFLQVKIDSAPKKYKDNDGWISIDPSCNSCDFGEIPYQSLNTRREFLYAN